MAKSARTTGKPPARQGFTMPAEWERHTATWLIWPRNAADWPGKLTAVRWACAEIIRKIATGERVRLIVGSGSERAAAERFLSGARVDLGQIDFIKCGSDRAWTRDTGPLFVRRDGRRPGKAVVDFHFNGWARYRTCRKDARIATHGARWAGCKRFDARCRSQPFVLEGGAIDVNGSGSLLTTEECLLDQETQCRNPGLSREDVTAALAAHLGVRNVIWLGRGIAGDDTHGHVDDLCRFVDRRTVVLAQEDDPADANHRALAENRDRLAGARLEDGARLEIVPLPMPGPLHFGQCRLPASYANFYIANSAVLVPTFNDPRDREALGILGELFRDRPVIGIHAVDLVLGLGTLHCLTQQEPA